MGMEVNVLNELPGGGGILTVSTHPNATVDSLIGAACQVSMMVNYITCSFIQCIYRPTFRMKNSELDQ